MANKILKPISTNRYSIFIGRTYKRQAWPYKERLWKMNAYELARPANSNLYKFSIYRFIFSVFSIVFGGNPIKALTTLSSAILILNTTQSQEKINNYILNKKTSNNISGILTKIPSMTPGFGRVTIEDTLSQEKYSVLSDSLTGEYSLSVPSGTYKTSIEFQPGTDTSHYMETNTTITKDTIINYKNYPKIRSESTAETFFKGKPLLFINKILTNTYEVIELQKFKETMDKQENQVIDTVSRDIINKLSTNKNYYTILTRAPNIQRYYPRRPNPNDPHSCPTNFEYSIDRAKDSVLAAGKGKIIYREENTDSTEGLSYIYKNNNEMTEPGALGITHHYYNNYTLYKVLVEINKTLNDSSSSHTVDLREKIRSLSFACFSPDNQYVTYVYANQSRKYHPDEKKIIELTYSLDIGTDMLIYKTDSTVTRDIKSGVNLENITSTIPEGYKISNPYPNPFNPETNIEFTIPKKSEVNINVYNSLGQLVEKIIQKELTPGTYNIKYDRKDKPSGTYFFKIEATNNKEKYTETKKGIIIK